MDWRSVKFDWNRARAFLVTAEEGSLSAAARALGMAQPTLGRQVSALEQELDVALFERVGRGLVLTPSGQLLLEHVRAMGEAATRMSRMASGQSQTLDGEICITASEAHAAFLLPPIIAELRQLYPGVEIELVATNSPRDLQRREADIALRSFRPQQPELIARKVRDARVHLYASPQYMKRVGPIRTVEDLSRAEIVGFDKQATLIERLNELGLKLTQHNVPIVSQNHLVQWAMVKAGVGIGLMQEDIGDAEPSVQRVDVGATPIVIPLWLLAHRDVNTSRRVRTVFELMYERLASVAKG